MFRKSHHKRSRKAAAFSLIELVIVVVIIAIIGAIAIPRMSRGAAGAADSALISNLGTLRSALDLYATEHGGAFPSVSGFVDQLTKYSNADGSSTSATKTSSCIYGPYLRSVPALPVGANKNDTGIADASSATIGATTGNFGWFYNATTGNIQANCTNAEVDASNAQYNAY
jgi:general secretion pathway protein G